MRLTALLLSLALVGASASQALACGFLESAQSESPQTATTQPTETKTPEGGSG